MVGIYALYWSVPDLVYIGQSQNINARKARHFLDLRKGLHPNKKVQQAYNTFGLPEFVVLQECLVSELNSLERTYAKEFDNTLNIDYYLGKTRYGFETPRSKYSKYAILKVFILLCRNLYTYRLISEKTRVNKSVIASIACGMRHVWLKDLYPEKYSLMLNMYKYGDSVRGKCRGFVKET